MTSFRITFNMFMTRWTYTWHTGYSQVLTHTNTPKTNKFMNQELRKNTKMQTDSFCRAESMSRDISKSKNGLLTTLVKWIIMVNIIQSLFTRPWSLTCIFNFVQFSLILGGIFGFPAKLMISVSIRGGVLSFKFHLV